MSDRFICPFCGDVMKLTSLYMDGNHRYSHKYIGGLSGGKDRCPFDGETLPLRALQEIHRTRKALDVAKDAIDVISLKYHKDTPSIFLIKYAQNAKAEITALEQKNHFADVSKKVEQKDVK